MVEISANPTGQEILDRIRSYAETPQQALARAYQ